jgi:hypothetical protein
MGGCREIADAPSGKARSQGPLAAKACHFPLYITDIARGAFAVKSPGQAAALAADLGKHFEVTRGKRDKTRVLSKVERGVLAVSGQTEHQPSTGGQGAVGGEIREPEGRPDRRTAGEAVPGIHPGGFADRAPLRRDRTRPSPLAQARAHDGRRRHRDE